MEDCNQLGNVVKMNEILDPNPKIEDNNNSVFEHLMHHYLDSQNLVSNPPSPTAHCVPLQATLLEQLAQDAADLQEAAKALDRLSEEDTLAQWVKEALSRRFARACATRATRYHTVAENRHDSAAEWATL